MNSNEPDKDKKENGQKEQNQESPSDNLNLFAKVLEEEDNENDNENKTNSKLSAAEKAIKILKFIRYYSTMKILKDDNKPVEIIDGLYIGSFAASGNSEELKKCGITHIIAAGAKLKKFFPNDYIYLQYDLLDSDTADIKQYFDEAGDFIDQALKEGGKVLVHCHAGISRSSSIILSYLIKYKKMTLEEALSLAREKREKINPNPGFIKQLKEYEEENIKK